MNPDRPSPSEFTEEILPRLRGASAAPMARATGLSSTYCLLIRKGKKVPHPRHWEALRKVAAAVSHGALRSR